MEIKLVVFDIDGVITNGKININHSGDEVKTIDLKDIDAIYDFKRKGYKTGVITGEKTPIVEYFENRFEFDYFYKGYKNKIEAMNEILSQEKLKIEEICYIGDGKHDIELLEYAGLSVCPNDAIDSVKNVCDVILNKNGGCGCIEELLNILESRRNESEAISLFERVTSEHFDLFGKLRSDMELKEKISNTADIILDAYKKGRKLLICGNGGSAADAQHIAAEFVGRFYKERKALYAEALSVNSSIMTALGNDYGYDIVFSRQIEAVGNEGDVLMGISTSGQSASICNALKKAKEMNLKTVLFTGNTKNLPVNEFSDVVLNIPSAITPRIQEAHIFIAHFLCEYVENKLFE